jgi:tripartite-type tricarboxylate transporter receptor subunit TctC
MAYAKANPGKLNYGSAGVGSASHLGCVMLDQAMGTNAQHVPYRGTGPAMQDLIGGRIDFLCDIAVTAVPAIKGGTVKGLATLAGRRMAVLPDMPTAAESAVPAEGNAGADCGKAERRDRRRHERAGFEGTTG